ncbi:DNA repair protein UVH3 isoform X2 [Juglans microcarpa x Juglans regia]|uniref:DNA repair protein UVH3 isoform X2 n=1 Tax=Juglans microcarpa x Juglans regia TaxID=2249226 RepID=UPI001B7DB509|nr:DNA repair protein UVH3 isoform X2 [Juglans microcarpa x Juglans regia]
MGVHGLWELLAPVGRRVSVETLAGKKLAIDASIWMVQFMKAMRDEKGEMIRNAHLLGFFRRICKLLFLRTKPVFVFDGATPALKRRTVIARRRQRDNAQAKVRKTAEKLLLNQLKAMKLKELAKEIENQKKRQKKQKNDAKGEKTLSEETNMVGNQLERDMVSKSFSQEKLDEMLAASIAAEDNGRFPNNASTSAAAAAIIPAEEDDSEVEERILPPEHGEIDPAVLASLPQSMQHDLLVQLKGKMIMPGETGMFGCSSNGGDAILRSGPSGNQEKLDEMLAASILAEEIERSPNCASKSADPFPFGENGEGYEDEDEDEEMMLPEMNGEFDPTVLAALPPSMQLDLLVQMRERLMAENRQKYQKVKKDPTKFSELQIQAYLKTVAFRREIDEVQKSAAGSGVGGVQTSRIASEANREFIFSSSFTGDKQAFRTARGETNGDKQLETPREHPSQNFINSVASASKSNAMSGSGLDESRRVFDDNIETYMDERGHVRVSRVRAMGIRMTRDIQRNLDLMKEVEQESTNARKIANAQTMVDGDTISAPRSFPGTKQSVETSHYGNSESVNLNGRNEESNVKSDTSIEISLIDGGENGDDDLFARLVAGNPVKSFSADNTPSRKQSSNLYSNCDWEEGIIKDKVGSFSSNNGGEIKPSLEKDKISDESDVEWEEGLCNFHKSTSPEQAEAGRTVSKGYLEEEADLQEAIRRSLEYVGDKESSLELPQVQKNLEEVRKDIAIFGQKNNIGGKLLVGEHGSQESESFCEIVYGDVKPNGVAGITVSQIIECSGRQLKSSVACSSDNSGNQINKPCERQPGSHSEQAMQDASERDSLYREIPGSEYVAPLQKEVHVVAEQPLGTFSVGAGSPNFPSRGSEHNSHISGANTSGIQIGDELNDPKTETKLAAEEKNGQHGSPFEGNENIDAEVIEGTLAEEIQILGQEYLSLGDEQRKLERNAESVSSEMFAECQELLQMFGLPYIIAPMEAEAQCAYMELANLVDGVVTDDSDVFLFGARSVYKNIFDDRKYVETYLMKDMEKELGLTREKLIRMALLLGSDYTEGVSGIGIVNAIEVVNAFPEKDGLHKFREWIESPDPTILKKFDAETGSTVKKRGPKVIDNGLKCSKRNLEEVSGSDLNILEGQEQQQSVTSMHDIKQIFMDKHRNVSKNWHIPPVFPSEAVVSAYFSPQVDNSTEPFTWGKPDHFVLRKLCWEKFGWGNQKADELLVPVLKEYDKHETQLRLEAFYTFNERFAKIRSKRIKKAVKGITGSQTLELMDNPLLEVSRSRKKRRANPVEPGDNKSEKPSSEIEGSDVGNQHYSMDKSLPKHSRKRRNSVEPIPAIPPMETEGRRSRNKGSHGNGRGGRRGRGRGDGVGRGRGKRSSGFEPRESSGNDTDDDEQEVLVENLEVPDKVRRSMRIRKPVNYTVNDSMMDDGEKSSDQSDEKCSAGEAVGRDLSSAQVVCEDAAAGHNENKQHNNAGDYAHEEHLHIDYHEMGGGFCTDKCEIDLPDVSQCGDPSFGAEFCKDYLNAGGGFCLDEGETKNDQDGTHCPTANASGSADPDPSHRIDFTNEADLDFGSVQSNLGPKGALDGLHATGKTDAYDTESNLDLQNASSNEGNSKEDASPPRNTTGKTSVGGLSAMPFLKRKRRKS